jgi:hypothetical protein
MQDTTPQAPSIKDLMPPRYIAELKLRTGCKQRQTIWDVVKEQVTGSKYWPAIEQLAKETNPEGFARWQEAQSSLSEVAAS